MRSFCFVAKKFKFKFKLKAKILILHIYLYIKLQNGKPIKTPETKSAGHLKNKGDKL